MPRTKNVYAARKGGAFQSSRCRYARSGELLGLTADEIAADAQGWTDLWNATNSTTTATTNHAAASTTADNSGGSAAGDAATATADALGSKVFGSWGSPASGWGTASREGTTLGWGTWTAAEWAKWHGGSMDGWPGVD
ncbi:hypothetical protein C8F04DRAFT_1181829 [Mycena alexandri]|uniref:Uncharacterized protein n=1 Tax=Mycena alexandri TaxID=1745969 RepID=A0AAD6T2C0_9AGAR|nr:hypothetical protein C8F04DRAFT_1181829 [Mycena alexandri]